MGHFIAKYAVEEGSQTWSRSSAWTCWVMGPTFATWAVTYRRTTWDHSQLPNTFSVVTVTKKSNDGTSSVKTY